MLRFYSKSLINLTHLIPFAFSKKNLPFPPFNDLVKPTVPTIQELQKEPKKNPAPSEVIQPKVFKSFTQKEYYNSVKNPNQDANIKEYFTVSKSLARTPFDAPSDQKIVPEDSKHDSKRDNSKWHDSKRDTSKWDDSKRDDLKRNYSKRDYSKRDDSKRDDPKRDDSKRDDPKRDDSKWYDPKRDNSKWHDSKRDTSKRDDLKRDELKRDDLKRDDSKRDDSKRDDSKRDDSKRDDWKRDISFFGDKKTEKKPWKNKNLNKEESPKEEFSKEEDSFKKTIKFEKTYKTEKIFKFNRESGPKEKELYSEESKPKEKKIFNFSQKEGKNEESAIDDDEFFNVKKIEKTMDFLKPGVFMKAFQSEIQKKPFKISEEEKTYRKDEKQESIEEEKPEAPAKDYQKIYSLLKETDRQTEKEENEFLEALLNIGEPSEIKENFLQILKKKKILWLSLENVHKLYLNLVNNSDFESLNLFLINVETSHYNFIQPNLVPLISMVSDSFLETDYEKNNKAIELLLSFHKFVKSENFYQLPNRPFFRSILALIEQNPEEREPVLNLAYNYLNGLANNNLLNFKSINPHDMAQWVILSLHNPESLHKITHILGEYFSNTFPVLIGACLQEFIRKEGRILYNREIIEGNYLLLKENLLNPKNKRPKSANGFEFLLFLADYHQMNEIILDLYPLHQTILKKTDVIFVQFIYDWMIKTIPNLKLDTKSATHSQIIDKVIKEQSKYTEKTRIHTLSMVKAYISEGNYRLAKDTFFTDLCRNEIVAYEKQKLFLFLEQVLISNEKSLRQAKQSYQHMKDLIEKCDDKLLVELFQQEYADNSILDNYPHRDLENYAENQKNLHVFNEMYEECNGSLTLIKKKIAARDKSYDQYTDINYESIGRKLNYLNKLRDEEQEIIKEKRKKVKIFIKTDQIIDQCDENGKSIKKKFLSTSEENEENLEDADFIQHDEKEVNEEDKENEDKAENEEKNEEIAPKNDFYRQYLYKFRDFKNIPENFDENQFENFLDAFEDNPDLHISENPSQEEEMAYLFALDDRLFKEDEERVSLEEKKLQVSSDLMRLKTWDLLKFVRDRMLMFHEVGQSVRVDCTFLKMEVCGLIGWGIQQKEPFAIYLCEKFADMMKFEIPAALAKQIDLFFDYSTDLGEELTKKFKRARESVEEIDRGNIYPSELEYNFIGVPGDFMESMNFLKKDPRHKDFAERKEREFPIILAQKYGFTPKWQRNLQKYHNIL